MTLANRVTAFRLFAAPVFLLLAMAPEWSSLPAVPVVVALWLLFAAIEASDMVDGMVARATNTVSDLGKLFDPFADVVARLTYFVTFVALRYVPVWLFLLLLYRELGILFLRMLMYRDGVALGARMGGKTKTVFYAISGAAGLALLSNLHAGWFGFIAGALPVVVLSVFSVAVLLAWVSFLDYLRQFVRHTGKTDR